MAGYTWTCPGFSWFVKVALKEQIDRPRRDRDGDGIQSHPGCRRNAYAMFDQRY